MPINNALFVAAEKEALNTIDRLFSEELGKPRKSRRNTNRRFAAQNILGELSAKIHNIQASIYLNLDNELLTTEIVCGAMSEIRNRALGCCGRNRESISMENYRALCEIIGKKA